MRTIKWSNTKEFILCVSRLEYQEKNEQENEKERKRRNKSPSSFIRTKQMIMYQLYEIARKQIYRMK